MGHAEHGEVHGGEGHAAHQVGHEDQLLGKVAVPLAAAAGADVAQELAAEGGDEGGDDGQADRVVQGAEELRIAEDAHVVGVLLGLARLADPVVERQVAQAVARAGGDLESFHNQHEEGHHHSQEQEHGQEGHHGLLGGAQRHQGAAAALAADGGVGLADADGPLVAHQDQSGQAHQNDGHGVTHAPGSLVDVDAHAGSQGVIADAVAQVGRHAVSADGLTDGHDQGGEHGGKDQRQGNVAQNLGLVGALDLAHLLQLRVDGAESAGDLDVREGVVVHGHAQHDGGGAIGQPVRDRYPEAGQETVRAAGGGPEDRQPRDGLGPGGNHIRHRDQDTEDLFSGEVGADHQPRQNRAQRHGDQRGEQAADEGVEQGLPQHGLGQAADQHILPIIKGKVTHVGPLDPPQLALGQGKGGFDHGQQRDDDQAEQHDQTDQHDHVEGVFDHVQDQVLQPTGRQLFSGGSFLCHSDCF